MDSPEWNARLNQWKQAPDLRDPALLLPELGPRPLPEGPCVSALSLFSIFSIFDIHSRAHTGGVLDSLTACCVLTYDESLDTAAWKVSNPRAAFPASSSVRGSFWYTNSCCASFASADMSEHQLWGRPSAWFYRCPGPTLELTHSGDVYDSATGTGMLQFDLQVQIAV